MKNAVKFFERTLHTVQSTDKLSVVMGTFKTGSTHIARVNAINNVDPEKDPFFELVGIVTMEDIIEEIIGDEIIDETDNFVHQEDQQQRTVRTQLDPLALVGIHHGKVWRLVANVVVKCPRTCSALAMAGGGAAAAAGAPPFAVLRVAESLVTHSVTRSLTQSLGRSLSHSV